MLLEAVRLFRWILRLDSFLPLIGGTMRADFGMASELVNDPELVFSGVRCIGIDDLRIAIDAAEQFFHRTWAEGVYRGFYQAEDENEITGLRHFAVSLSGNKNEDLLLASTAVYSATDQDIALATTLALRRLQVLDWTRKRYYGELPAKTSLEVLYS